MCTNNCSCPTRTTTDRVCIYLSTYLPIYTHMYFTFTFLVAEEVLAANGFVGTGISPGHCCAYCTSPNKHLRAPGTSAP